MKIADVSIRRPVFALMMSVALVTLGLFSYGSLGVDLMPRTEQPSVQVRVGLPGASAEDIASIHRTLMKRLHPDLGGTNYLAARVNEAKDTLLRQHR